MAGYDIHPHQVHLPVGETNETGASEFAVCDVTPFCVAARCLRAHSTSETQVPEACDIQKTIQARAATEARSTPRALGQGAGQKSEPTGKGARTLPDEFVLKVCLRLAVPTRATYGAKLWRLSWKLGTKTIPSKAMAFAISMSPVLPGLLLQ